MPLSKSKMRARKKADRLLNVKPMSNLRKGAVVQPVNPQTFGFATKDVPMPKWMKA